MYNEDGLEQAEEVISVVFYFFLETRSYSYFSNWMAVCLSGHVVDVEMKPDKVDFLLLFFLLD